jgi:peroxiredoxin
MIYFCLLCICLGAGAAFSQDEPEFYTRIGGDLPSFTIKDLDGKEFDTKNFKGKVAVIFLWATWCPYCAQEMPVLERDIWQKYKSSDDFVMLALARKENEAKISAYRKKYSYNFPMASDLDGKIFALFADSYIPRLYVVGIDGKIRYQSVGYDPTELSIEIDMIDRELKKIKKK